VESRLRVPVGLSEREGDLHASVAFGGSSGIGLPASVGVFVQPACATTSSTTTATGLIDHSASYRLCRRS